MREDKDSSSFVRIFLIIMVIFFSPQICVLLVLLVNGGIISLISVFLILILVVVFSLVIGLNKKKETTSDEEVLRLVNSYIPNYNEYEFMSEVFELYKKLLNCWTSLDKEGLRNIVSPEFYNKICLQMDERKNLTEVIDEVTFKGGKIVKINRSRKKVNSLVIGFNFSCGNYLINTSNNMVIMGGTDSIYKEYTELKISVSNGKIIILDRLLGMPYFSSNDLEKKIREDMDLDLYNNYSADMDIDKMKQKIFQIYKAFLGAISEYDYDTLNRYTTSSLYQIYKVEVSKLQKNNQKRIIKDVELIDCKILDINVNGDRFEESAILEVEQYDYIVDSKNELLKGNDDFKVHYKYSLHLVKESKKTEKCPNCGSNLIEDIVKGKCSYCGSKIVPSYSVLVLNNISCIQERTVNKLNT